MPHVKRKRIRGNEYYYLVHNHRRGGKVKTRTLEYLGKEPPGAEELARLREKHSKPGTQLTLSPAPSAAGAGAGKEPDGRQNQALRRPHGGFPLPLLSLCVTGIILSYRGVNITPA